MTPAFSSARGHWSTTIMVCIGVTFAALPGCSGCQQTPDSQVEVEEKPQSRNAPRPEQPEHDDDAEGAPVAKSESQVPDRIEPMQAPAAAEKSGTSESGGASAADRPRNAESALKSAQELRQQARQAAAKQDFGRAFVLTTRAWDASRRFSDDVGLSELTEVLAAESEEYGAQANSESSARASDSDTKLTEQ